MNISPDQITAIILAGGQGRRMGGIDKGLQNFKGAPLALHALLRLQPQVGSVCINANRNLGVYEGFGVHVICDKEANFPGPLAGMHAALYEADVPFLVTVPCDVPSFPADLVEKLKAPFEADPSLQLSVASTAGRSHPVFCMMRIDVYENLDEFMRSGGRKIDAWYAKLNHAVVEFDDEDAFHNVNTLAELKELESRA
ncbi:molybdenum cofactor guanylyltransferase [Limnobacter humi]|uniref:Molybdenum cofactor guanylyltransferase n=1 Tax=Limnobacter humi TaxID=1778671 RepID=A0ABT1WEF4_9BURK|nr:molybdenum cofactor guanylyltransferase MobA [Limnobacter humi]MCQ8895900.1 molybdenum cofactor guanylyltransferase [Limnobacter humi]